MQLVAALCVLATTEEALAKKPKGTIGYMAPGDSNAYMVKEISRKSGLVIEIVASSGPGATASGGSIAKKQASAETIAKYYATDYGCDAPQTFGGIAAEKTMFDETTNTWTVGVICQ
ncbi:hypothetical protein OU426_03615 [Frigidibacter sp. RF13]|uniref:hypothetical protein n=1 Tax=Frigidibacter sp. RF13 TaxID=2997340 RepID=UPI002271DA91|nr:hypothetical protein [Frigidibacter sp. RF13]MCY1125932.1 hypothetical protein [Frigidibacter sp. RF13]